MCIWPGPGASVGGFSVSYAYNGLCGYNFVTGEHHWKKVWKMKVQERIRLLLHDRLLTKSRLSIAIIMLTVLV
jgi:hypothetical protein